MVYWQRIVLSCAALAAVMFGGAPSLGLAASILQSPIAMPQERIKHGWDEASLVTLHGNVHPALKTSQDQGVAPADTELRNIILVLQPTSAQQQALDEFTRQQQDPSSPRFRKWLTPDEYQQNFGVHGQDIAVLKSYLSSHGFVVDQVPPGGRAILFHGNAGQIKAAFHTEIHQFIWRGETHIANSSNPQIPAAFSEVVGGIANLHDFQTRAQWKRGSSSAADGLLGGLNALNLIPAMDNGNWHYLTPSDFAVIYDLNPLYNAGVTGKGATIAVIGKSDVQLSDIAQFQSVNQPPFTGLNPPQVIQANGDPGFVSGDQLESTLDVEWAGAIAPAATVKFVTSPGGVIGSGRRAFQADGIFYSAMYAVTNNLADIISVSYSGCEASMGYSSLNYINSLWQQAATQGISVLVASGDSGAADCDSSSSSGAVSGLAVNGLCSSPYSTCVGGTELNDTSNISAYWLPANPAQTPYTTAISYIPEVVWNDSGSNGGSDLWATGGGASLVWPKPSWQVSPGVPNDGARDVPDVALNASTHTGYQIWSSDSGTLQQEYIGGTSAATPSFAGILALGVQYTGGRLGNVNPLLYGLSQLQANGGYSYYHRISSGNNSVPGQVGYSANGGYSQTVGLGSVDAALFIRQANAYTNLGNSGVRAAINQIISHLINPESASVRLTSSAASPVAGQTVTFTAQVSGDAPSGGVQFLVNGHALGSATLSGGQARLSASLSAGEQSVTAVYGGDVNNLGATSAALAENVLTAASVSLGVSATTIQAGQSLILTATVSGSNPSGTVQFYLNGKALGTAVSLVNGVATLTTNGVTVTGSDSLTASYSGDANNGGSASNVINETVTAVQPTFVPALPPLAQFLLLLLAAGLSGRFKQFNSRS